MTPDQISAITALAGLVKSMGTWPIMSILIMVVLGPWVVNAYTSYQHQRRFEAVAKMYENNVMLAEDYKGMAEGYRDQLIWSTQTVTEAKDIAKNNLHCPMVRKQGRPRDLE